MADNLTINSITDCYTCILCGAVVADAHRKAHDRFHLPMPEPKDCFQDRVGKWLIACFGRTSLFDKRERSHRFIEEALELAQSVGMARDEVHQLVDYVFNRPSGKMAQEIGGTLTTLAALCSTNGHDLDECGEAELRKMWQHIDKIRMKQAAKPKYDTTGAAPANEKDLPLGSSGE